MQAVGRPGLAGWPRRLLLLSFALGLYRLGFQAALGDDAFSLVIAGRSLGELLRLSASEPHPPVFYVLLWGWVRLAGDGEFAGRFVAVWWGLLAAALTYRLGARLMGGRRAAALAALLLVASPLFVAYSPAGAHVHHGGGPGASLHVVRHRICCPGSRQAAGAGPRSAGYAGDHSAGRGHPLLRLLPGGGAESAGRSGLLPARQRRALRVWMALQGLWLAAYAPWVAVALPTLSGYGNELVSRPTPGPGLCADAARLRAGRIRAGRVGLACRRCGCIACSGASACWRRRSWLPLAYCFLPPVLVFVASLCGPCTSSATCWSRCPVSPLVAAAGATWRLPAAGAGRLGVWRRCAARGRPGRASRLLRRDALRQRADLRGDGGLPGGPGRGRTPWW